METVQKVWSEHSPTCAARRLELRDAGAERIEVVVSGADNWLAVPDARRRYLAAALRHLTAWAQGEKLDPESGHHHLAHAACCVLFLLAFDLRGLP